MSVQKRPETTTTLGRHKHNSPDADQEGRSVVASLFKSLKRLTSINSVTTPAEDISPHGKFIFTLQGINKTYATGEVLVHALQPDLVLYTSELVVLLRASGSGKSTRNSGANMSALCFSSTTRFRV